MQQLNLFLSLAWKHVQLAPVCPLKDTHGRTTHVPWFVCAAGKEDTMRRCKSIAVFTLALVTVGLSAQQQQTQQQSQQTGMPGPAGRFVLVRSCDVVAGKGEEATKFALEMAALSKPSDTMKPPFESYRVYSEMFGDVGRLHFVMEFANFNALGALMAGPPPEKIQAVIKQGATVVRSCKDTVMRELRQQQ
jgi:hypothetical protein